jgi:hypothetical protein
MRNTTALWGRPSPNNIMAPVMSVFSLSNFTSHQLLYAAIILTCSPVPLLLAILGGKFLLNAKN